MQKNLLTFISILMVCAFFFTACSKIQEEKKLPPETGESVNVSATEAEKETVETTTVLTDETTSEETEETQTQIAVEKETEGIPVSDPTRKPDEPAKIIRRPQKVLFYSEGKSQELTPEMIDNITEEINEEFEITYFAVLKLAVMAEDIVKLKENNRCLELQFNSVQKVSDNCDCIDPHGYTFEKLLIVLDGERENIIFLEENGVYKSGPLEFMQSDLAEDLLEVLYD